MPKLTEKHFFKYAKCPLWLYFDEHEEEQKLVDPLIDKLADDGLIPEIELEILKRTKDKGQGIKEIEIEDIEEAFRETLEAMREGVQTIYHGVLVNGHWVARPDLLERVEGKSRFGDYYYVACDVKRGRKVTREYMFQGSFYAELLMLIQGIRPVRGYVIDPDGVTRDYLLEDYRSRFHLSLDEIERIMAGKRPAHFMTAGCKHSPWFDECKLEAESCDDVSLLNRIYAREVTALREAGYGTISRLANTGLLELEAEVSSVSGERLMMLHNQAKSIIEDKIVVKDVMDFPESETELYFDIESDPLRDLDYLFGVLEVKKGKEKYHAFVAKKPEDEQKAFEQFLKFMGKHPDVPVYHYGWYEVEVLRRLGEKYDVDPVVVAKIESQMIDLMVILRDNVIFPLYFYSLKDLAKHLGFKWRNADATGIQSVLWYEEYLQNRRKKSKLDEILKYNEDDVLATKFLKEWATKQDTT